MYLDASYLSHRTGDLPTTSGRQTVESLHIGITQGYLKHKSCKSWEFNPQIRDQRVSALTMSQSGNAALRTKL